MPEARGEVGLVYEKTGGKWGSMYSIKLEGDDTWYRCGKKRPEGIDKGDVISFDYSIDAKGASKVDLDSIKKVESAKASSGGGGNTFTSSTGRQDAIMWQSARNAAIEMAKVLVSVDALDVSANATKGSKAKALALYVNMLTVEFFKDATAAQDGELADLLGDDDD